MPISGEPPKSQIEHDFSKNSKPRSLTEIYAVMRKIQKETSENIEECDFDDDVSDIVENDSEECDYDL